MLGARFRRLVIMFNGPGALMQAGSSRPPTQRSAQASTAASTAARLVTEALEAIGRNARAVAVDRLIDAEAAVVAEPVCWPGRQLLARGYRKLRMYELAEPHLERAAAADRWMVADLHLDWANELDQVVDTPVSVPLVPTAATAYTDTQQLTAAEHRRVALAELESAGVRSTGPAASHVDALVAAMADECRLAADPATVDVVADEPDADFPGSVRVRGLVARSTALLALRRIPEALRLGRRATEVAAGLSDSAGVRSASLAMHRAQVAAGHEGALTADRLVRHTVQRLWQARWNAVLHAYVRRNTALLDERRESARLLADRDPLTGLANRDRLGRWLADRPTGPVTLVMADLTSFKSVNDRFGHNAGDRLLMLVATSLQTALPQQLVCRIGGDEFVVVDDRAEDRSGDRADEMIRAIREALSSADIQDLLDEPLPGCDFGWAARPAGADTAGLLDEADGVLRYAKRGRRQ